MTEDKILQFLQQKLVGQLRLERQPRGNMRKKTYEESRSRWPVVMIVKIERQWQTLWPKIPEKREKIYGFRVHYMCQYKGRVRIRSLTFNRAKWILKNFPKTSERISTTQLTG